MLKKLSVIFAAAFLLNWVWENLHSVLYVYYQGESITQLILLRASIFDAVFITFLGILFLRVEYFRQRLWWALIFGFIFAVLLERWALTTGRWVYRDLMPILPLLGIGLTPAVQLSVTAGMAYWIERFFDRKKPI